jgi:hypothetical protein
VRSLAGPLALLAAVAACNTIDLEAVSEPPPTKKGRILADDRKIQLSSGVALAVQCVDTCDGPCRAAKVWSKDGAVVGVEKAYHFAGVARGESEEHNAATYVLLGLSAGKTEVRVKSDCTDDTYDVVVSP